MSSAPSQARRAFGEIQPAYPPREQPATQLSPRQGWCAQICGDTEHTFPGKTYKLMLAPRAAKTAHLSRNGGSSKEDLPGLLGCGCFCKNTVAENFH